jgi:S1-C subfamily serine protease
MTDQGVRGNAPSPDPTRAGSPELAAAFGRPPGVAESFAPAPLPPPRRAEIPPPQPSVAQRHMFGRPEGLEATPFDPPPGSRPDPTPAPESPWWKPDAPRDPWRDAGSQARLGAPPDLDGEPPAAEPEGLPDVAEDGRRRRRFGLRQISLTAAIVLLVGALLAGVAGGVTGYMISSRVQSALLDPDSTLTSVSPPVNRPAGSIADIAKRVLPAVVSIEVRSASGSGTGSGVVIAGEGYILTNNHVISEAATDNGTLRALFQDQSAAPARIVGRDPKSDLAVIKVDKKGLTVASLGDSSSLAVGDPVIAIGSPLGLAGTVTSGIVSALNRPVRLDGQGSDTNAVINAIQTDAAINPGNSGGALVDGAGAVIGINSAIATLSSGGRTSEGGSIGVGFAIPMNEAKDIAQQLIRTGSVKHATLGVTAKSVTDGARDGALIESISPGGGAAKAGLQEGDVITKIDDTAITGSDQLIVTVRAHKVGQSVAVSYVRAGKTRHATATLQAD